MAQSFKETAHNNTDKKKFDEGWDRIFGKKKKTKKEIADDLMLDFTERLDKLCTELEEYYISKLSREEIVRTIGDALGYKRSEKKDVVSEGTKKSKTSNSGAKGGEQGPSSEN